MNGKDYAGELVIADSMIIINEIRQFDDGYEHPIKHCFFCESSDIVGSAIFKEDGQPFALGACKKHDRFLDLENIKDIKRFDGPDRTFCLIEGVTEDQFAASVNGLRGILFGLYIQHYPGCEVMLHQQLHIDKILYGDTGYPTINYKDGNRVYVRPFPYLAVKSDDDPFLFTPVQALPCYEMIRAADRKELQAFNVAGRMKIDANDEVAAKIRAAQKLGTEIYNAALARAK